MTQPTNETKSSDVVAWLSRHWFLLAFVVGSGTVWGQYTQKVDRLEDAVKQWSAKEDSTRKLQSQVDLLDYRTKKLDEQNKQILEAQAQQSRDIQTLIILQQRTLSGVNSSNRQLQTLPQVR